MTASHEFILKNAVVGLRHFTLGDVTDVTTACQDDDIIRWTATIPSPYTAADARGWIEQHEDWRRQGSAHHFAIVDRADGRLSGSVSLDSVQVPPVQVGYWVAPWGRNRGLATHALRLASTWAFDNLPCTSISLVTKVGNERSERVATNGGYAFIDKVRDYKPAKSSDRFDVKRWVLRDERAAEDR